MSKKLREKTINKLKTRIELIEKTRQKYRKFKGKWRKIVKNGRKLRNIVKMEEKKCIITFFFVARHNIRPNLPP